MIVDVETNVPRSACQESRRIWPEEWEAHWPQIQRSLDLIREYWEDLWTKESIYDCVMMGRWQAWGFGVERDDLNVIVLTQITDFPAGRLLQIVLCWGNQLDKLLPTMEGAFERFAIESESRVCEIWGREGWERKLPRFKRFGVVLRARVPKRGVH